MRVQFLAFSGVMFALAVVVCVQSASLVLWTPIGPGPGFFTGILGVLLGGLALGLAWDERKRAIAGAAEAGDPAESVTNECVADVEPAAEPQASPVTGTAGRPAGKKKLVLVTAALVALPFVFEPLGYHLTVFLLLAYLLVFVERRRIIVSLIVAAAVSAGSFYLFSDLLDVPLPLGLIGR